MKIDLKSIKSPADIRNYDMDGLELLCASLRAPLIRKLGAHGGHVGPNLGVVEATVALHYVFNTPADRIVFDVSHQTYVHKMLTGRIEAFLDPDHYSDVTGYTNPRESDYDLFEVGHTSTSIALAVGLAKARDLEGGSENVVAFIGDASVRRQTTYSRLSDTNISTSAKATTSAHLYAPSKKPAMPATQC